MKFKLSAELIEQAGRHAAERGMSLEEYIQEFIGILNEEKAKGNVDLDIKSIQDKVSADS